MIDSVLYAISWAGIVMLFDFCMWQDNILSCYWKFLNESKYRIAKAFGLCHICFGFWFGMLYLLIDKSHYFIFLGISELILIFYFFIKRKN